MKRIKVMDTSFRDGFQSVYGARVFVDDFIPALQSAVSAGINHFEVAGGARFQSPIFYCRENAFETMDKIRNAVGPDVNLQSLSRGVNVVGLESQPRDIINLHAKMFKKHGVTTIRNFDALNDVNNLIYSGQCIKDNGLKHEVTITMMELPIGCEGAHDVAFYERVLRSILDAGIPFDSLAFKDASGTSSPQKVYETLKRTREILGEEAHIRFHSHETAGTGLLAYKAALDGGADGIDLSMKPVSGGTAQPDIVSMWHALKGTEYDLGINIEKILETEEIFKECMKDYFLPPEALAVNPMIIQSPLPGGALTANTQMLRDNNLMDKYPQIVSGTGRIDLAVPEITNGRIIAKIGSDAVYCLAVKDEDLGIAFKIEDGSFAAVTPMTIAVLKHLDLLTKDEATELDKIFPPVLKNHRGEIIGTIETVF